MIDIDSADQYLDRFTYSRNWSGKKRLIVSAGDDNQLDEILNEARDDYACQLALRNMVLSEAYNLHTVVLNLTAVITNLHDFAVHLGHDDASETTFGYSGGSDSAGVATTRNLSQELKNDLRRKFSDLVSYET